jgi:acetyl-CoA carboxylase beta subunit
MRCMELSGQFATSFNHMNHTTHHASLKEHTRIEITSDAEQLEEREQPSDTADVVINEAMARLEDILKL